jgi:4-carboxymuconolactone decarboxylase
MRTAGIREARQNLGESISSCPIWRSPRSFRHFLLNLVETQHIDKKEPVMPRIAPVTGKSDVPAEHHAVVEQVVKMFGNVRGPFSMLLHSPKLAERLLGLVTFFRDESVVEGTLRSIAILSAVREREAAYVWAAQVAAARRNGLREEVIDLIRAKGDPGKLPAEERDIVTYTRQLMRTNRIDQTAFDALKNRHSEQWLVELTAAANYFALLSGVVNAFEVAAPPDGDKLPV